MNSLVLDWEKAIKTKNFKSTIYLIQKELNKVYEEIEKPNKIILDLIAKIEIHLLISIDKNKGIMKEWVDEGIVHNIPRTLEWINLELKEVQEVNKSNKRLNDLIIKIDETIRN